MSSERVDSERKGSGNQANVPARIRRELDIVANPSRPE